MNAMQSSLITVNCQLTFYCTKVITKLPIIKSLHIQGLFDNCEKNQKREMLTTVVQNLNLLIDWSLLYLCYEYCLY